MHIIFGSIDKELSDKYTVLELDTVKTPSGQLVQHWCLIENVPLNEYNMLDLNKDLHAQLIEKYRQRNWEFCRAAIESLTGKWNGEVDSFYEEISKRIERFTQNPPDESWDGYWAVEHSVPA
jgi:hypothetical protein